MIKFEFKLPVDLIIIKKCYDEGGNVFLIDKKFLSNGFCVEYFYQFLEMMEDQKEYLFDVMIFPADKKMIKISNELI